MLLIILLTGLFLVHVGLSLVCILLGVVMVVVRLGFRVIRDLLLVLLEGAGDWWAAVT